MLGISALALPIAGVLNSCGPGKGDDGVTVDCFPWTRVCGQPCNNPCGGGCLACFPGSYCRDGIVIRCNPDLGCTERIETCDQTDACVGVRCAKSRDDCEDIRAAYEAQITQNTSSIIAVARADGRLPPGQYGPGCFANCKVEPGDCVAGLDTCWVLGERTPEMGRLAGLYQRLGCPALTEDCACPPSNVSCQGIQQDPPREACVVSEAPLRP